jgi:hypothetical protein
MIHPKYVMVILLAERTKTKSGTHHMHAGTIEWIDSKSSAGVRSS